ncbi:MAG: STAS domain-containing protein [Pseudomonadota bacterium]
MSAAANNKMYLHETLINNEATILNEWIEEQITITGKQSSLKESELREQCKEFLHYFIAATRTENTLTIKSAEWEPVLKLLAEVSQRRNEQGFSPSETATFVFSFKKPFFKALTKNVGNDAVKLSEAVWSATYLLDKLGLYTTEVYQKAREEIIMRQQQDMLELSTPVVSMAEGILALPLIGTLDSARTQIVMESLLERIVATSSAVAIIDITGVPTVDTLVAQHLLKTVAAARLMGADCIISGIRPQIAQTIVHLGVDLGTVSTKATLASAFKLALERTGMAIVRTKTELRHQEGK